MKRTTQHAALRRRRFTAALCGLLAVVLLVGLLPTAALAGNSLPGNEASQTQTGPTASESGGEEEAPGTAAPTEEELPSVSSSKSGGPSGAPSAAPTAPTPQKNTRANDEPTEENSVFALAATFDGQDLAEAGNRVEYSLTDGNTNSRTLGVDVSFSGTGSGIHTVEGRTLEIVLQPGLKFQSIPGMAYTGGRWVENFSSLTDSQILVVEKAEFFPYDDYTAANTSMRAVSGRLVYTFKEGALSTSFAFSILFDTVFAANADPAGKVFENALSVQASEVYDGESRQSEALTLEEYVITTRTGLAISHSGVLHTAPGAQGKSEYAVLAYWEGGTNIGSGVHFDTIRFSYVADRQLLFSTNPQEAITPLDGLTWDDMDVQVEPDVATGKTTIHFTIRNVMMVTAEDVRIRFQFNYTLSAEAVEGKTYYLRGAGTPEVTPPGGSAGLCGRYTNTSVVCTSASDTLAIEPDNVAQGNGIAYVDDADRAEGDAVVLGLYKIQNKSSAASGPQALRIEVPTDVLTVRLMRLPVGATGAQNITLTTREGKTLTAENLAVHDPITNSLARCAILRLDEIDGVSATDGIASVQYTTGEFAPGYGAYSYNSSAQPTLLFGSFVQRSAAYTIKVYNAASGTIPESWGTPVLCTYHTTDDQTYNITATGVSNGMRYLAGNRYTISTRVNGYPSGLGSVGYAYYVKGHEIYLREMGLLTIDEASIQLQDTRAGTAYSTEGFTVTKGVDGEGHTVYKITAPNHVVSRSGNYGTTGITFAVRYSFTVNKDIATQRVNLNHFLYTRPIPTGRQQNIFLQPTNSTTTSCTNPNEHDVWLDGNTEEMYHTLSRSASADFVANPIFRVNTAAQMVVNGTPQGWKTFDEDKPDTTQLRLPPDAEAHYRVQVMNNTDEAAGKFVVHIPVPSRGESFGSYTSDGAFGWTAAMEGPITTEDTGAFKISYSTEDAYQENHLDASNFTETWSADAKTIRVESTAPMPANTIYTFQFKLRVVDVDANDTSGPTNTYSSLVYREVGSDSLTMASEPVSIRIDNGLVVGRLYNDVDRSLSYTEDGGDTPRRGVAVAAYDQATGTPIGETVYTDAEGMFVIPGLSIGQKVKLEITNPVGDADTLRFTTAPTEAKASLVLENVAATAGTTPLDAATVGLLQAFAVSFNAEGGAPAPAAVNGYEGETFAAPPTVTKPGYSFAHWLDESGTQATFPRAFAKNETLTAVWTLNTHTFTFDVEGTLATHDDVGYGTALAGFTPPTTDKTGHTFAGWFTAASGSEEVDLATATMPDGDLTVYAQWEIDSYTLAFDVEGTLATHEDVDYGTALANFTPPATAKTGYSFLGWFTAATDGVKVDLATATMPDDDLTLYAQWEINAHTLTFDVEGTLATHDDVEYGTALANFTPPATTKIGHTFAGWFTTASGGEEVDLATATMPDGDLTLYAQWEIDSYTLVFDVEGTLATHEDVDYGTALANFTPPATAKTGYSFLGWFTGPAGGAKIDLSTATMPARDFTLYARYAPIQYQLTFNYQGAGPNTQSMVAYGSAIEKPADPEKLGHSFGGWRAEDGTLWDFATGTMPARKLTLSAVWAVNEYTATYLSNGTTVEVRRIAFGGTLPALTPPAYNGHTFLYWQRQGTEGLPWNFENDTMPAFDVTLVAVWQRDAVSSPGSVPAFSASQSGSGAGSAAPPAPTPPASSSTARLPVASGSTSRSTAPSSRSAQQSSLSPASVVAQGGTSQHPGAAPSGSGHTAPSAPAVSSERRSTTILDMLNPLAAANNGGTWSVVNLALALLCLLMGIFTLVSLASHRYSRTGKILRAASAVLAAAAIAIFLLVELSNFGNGWVLLNRWSLLMAVLAIAVATLARLGSAHRTGGANDDFLDDPTETQPA